MDGAAYLNYRKTGRETSRDTAGWPRWRPVCGANIKRNRNTRHIPRRLCPVIKVILFFLSLCYLYCDLIPPQCVHSRPVIGTPSPPCHWRSRADPAELPRRSVLCRDGPPLWCWWWWLVHLEGGWVEGGAIKTWICGGITNGWVTQCEGSASCCLQPILFYCLIFANPTRKRWRRRRREKPPEGDSRRYYVDKVVVPKDK